MQWSLFLLILMGQCSFFTCQLYGYHFVDIKKTWKEAQQYCRDNYKDLATVSNMTDLKRFRKQHQREGWIGLHSPDANRMWHWSLPGVEFDNSTTKWAAGEPNDWHNMPENCVFMEKKFLMDCSCTLHLNFFCYNEITQNKFHFTNKKKTWPEAQKYCRENHTDLVSGPTQLEASSIIPGNFPDRLWIGLFRDTWRWSDGSSFSFRNWRKDRGSSWGECAATTSDGKWVTQNCMEHRHFFCYDDRVILINENKTWEEALYYCRENHYDLVSITNLDDQRWVQEKTKMATSSHVWLGLRYTCTLDFWFWISDKKVQYTNWDTPGEKNECDMSGAMDSEGQHKWFKKMGNEEFNFICSTC